MEFIKFDLKQEHDSEDELADYPPEVPFPPNLGLDPLGMLSTHNARGKLVTGSKTPRRARGGKVNKGKGAYIIKTFVPLASQSKVFKSPSYAIVPQIYHPAVRMIDLNLIAHSLWCVKCNQPLSLRNCVSDDSNSCRTQLQVRCLHCSKVVPITLSLLDRNGDCVPYCSSLITKGSNLNYKLLAERCLEVGMQLDLLNSLIPRPDNRGRSRPTPTIEIPEEKIMKVFRLNHIVMPQSARSSTVSSAQQLASEDNDFFDVNMFLEGPKIEPIDFEHGNTSQDSDMPDFEEHMEGEIEDLISDPEEEETKKKKYPVDDDWKPGSDSDENDSWAEDEDGEISALKRIRSKFPKDPNEPIIWEKCLYCELKFPNFMKARKHMESTHKEFKQLKCGACRKQFDLLEPFKNHIINYHRDSKSKLCPHCGKMCNTSGALTSHLASHKTEATVPCPKCPKLFKSKMHLYRHMGVHERTYTCDLCHKQIRKRCRLIEHMNMHIENETYDCEICGAKFVRKDNKKTHMNNNHNWICLVCNGKYLMMEEVKRHVEEVHPEDQIVEALGKGSVPYEKVTRFQCPTCFRFLASKQSLEFHMVTHTGEGKRRGRKKISK